MSFEQNKYFIDLVESWCFCEKLFTPEECEKIIEIGNQKEKQKAVLVNNFTDEKIRKNKISWLDKKDNIDWVYEKLQYAINDANNKYFNFDLSLFLDPLQFTEYKAPDNHYDLHVDKSYGIPARKLSVSLQLSNTLDYDGGDLDIITESKPFKMTKEQGTLILFPSYTLHKVNPITKGTRYSLVGWVTGKPFK
jgi:PKHD-type hydroxylase